MSADAPLEPHPVSSAQIAHYLDELLETKTTPDYGNALNGLQLANQGQIVKTATAVDFSSQTIARTIELGANLLIVHHGMFWGGLQPLRGPFYSRLKALMDNDVAVYASHLPLDRHATFGNNVLLAKELSLTPSAPFAQYKSIAIGCQGSANIPTHTLVEQLRQFARTHGGDVRTTPITSNRTTFAWAICTGGGANSETLREAQESGIDTLIVGEGPHHTAVDANELGIAILYAGHYTTETLGVRALGDHIATRFGIPTTFIDAPTGL